MYLINFFPSPLIISVVVIIFLLSLSFPESACSEDFSNPDCKSLFECGRLRDIGYPFWGNGRPSYCGHPKFELRCERGEPTIEIKSQKYHVLDIHHETQILKIARFLDLLNGNIVCPSDTTIDSEFFGYTSNDRNATLFYDCHPESQLPQNSDLLCMKDKKPEHAYFVTDVNLANQLASRCEFSVVVPVLATAAQGLADHSLLANEVLDQGFEVEWIADETQCRACVESGGICGYNSTSQKHFCGCGESHDQAYPSSCPNPPELPPASDFAESKFANISKTIMMAVVAAGVATLFASILIIFCFKRKMSKHRLMFIWRKRSDADQNIEEFVRNYGSQAPKRYSYSNVKKMTNSFKDKLGQGGYGGVYKGKLGDGHLVAVKVLNTSKGNGDEFINEVASISRTSHVNIVRLLGFCFEGGKKALIYEFMSNGSLENFLCSENPMKAGKHLGWEKLYQIAVGIARGLEYLHCGCRTKILHFDVKPHNILLDQDFSPKISDFGLAKLCPPKESIISMSAARGTIGYVAPEVFCRNFGQVSHKSDVYSYGMMVLEMVGGRQNVNGMVDHTSETYFPHWIYKRLERQEDLGLEGIENKEENKITRKMIVVGLWCIQTNPLHRPCMSKVIEMLEGSIEALQIPPKPFLSSPPRFPINSSSIKSTLSQ
ncbi:hypothetical protein PVL29_022107 [Vitis rotundifolia]|uniref:non-specific serine/threonine protein kinase n=1 Tax=Vitis rotundifolia TaxID=103349 RepID=A0AA38YUV2_VITRO|nr:hypothetical protein PVL29_022107 [Vitis rotundifolia]